MLQVPCQVSQFSGASQKLTKKGGFWGTGSHLQSKIEGRVAEMAGKKGQQMLVKAVVQG
jgi:hypothetical protein